MTETTSTEILPLHSTVENTIEGDCGWLWYEGAWRLGRIAFSDDERDDALYVDLLLPEKPEWFPVETMKDFPWVPIVRPPYDGDEQPCTHAVTIMDRTGSCTMAWNMNKNDGKHASEKIMRYVEAMLRETEAPVTEG